MREARALRRQLAMAAKKGGSKREAALQALFDLLLRGLNDKLASGEATAADFQAARQFLKDNNFEFDRENPPAGVKKLVEQLPDLDQDPDWPGNLPPN
jgi:hypothetical protein